MKKTALILILLFAYAAVPAQHGHGSHNSTEKKAVWLDDGLGGIDHPVTTKSVEAQKFFNQGLMYLYAFNHAEAINSFRHAAELDPEMAMAYWGTALGLGSNYNITADKAQLTEAYSTLEKAISLGSKATEAERDYIAALSKRYSADAASDREKLGNDYRDAMKALVAKYPDDLDAATLYAESMMNLRPWQLWSLDGKPAEGTLEILAVLEGVMKRNPKHTGANHYFIHAIEASPNPERGLAAAHRLMGLAPSAGHLVHMPSHIYLRTGDHDVAVKSNDLAIVADRKYIQRSGATGVYPLMYYNHNIHMLAAAHAGAGNFASAVKAAKELETNVGPNVKAMPMLEMFMPYHLVTLARFQKWDDILAYPQPDAEMKVTTAMWRLARGLAFNEKGKRSETEAELKSLQALIATIPADAGIGNSSAHGVLKVATELLAGEIALAKGDRKAGLESLRRAVAAEDLVNYNEPPDWHLPTREWLGRALMRNGEYAEAEAVFRKEIEKNPKNGRGLFGLAAALEKQGKSTSAALVKKEFEAAWKDADTKLTTNAFDRTSPAVGDARSGKVKLSTGITMKYVEAGDPNGPPVLLMHGYSDSSFSYSRVLPLLDKKYRILAIDHRGHGDSDKPESGYEMRDFAADAAAFLDAMNVTSAIVVGHSMGSFVAMQMALDHPEKVSRLVLVGTAAKARNAAVNELLGVVSTLPDPVPRDFVREFQVSTSSPDLPKDFLDRVVEESSKVPTRVWKKAMEGVAARDFTPDLKKIRVPVTVIWGQKETVFKLDEQEPLVKGLPNAKFVVYPNSGHAPNWEEPEKFAKELNQILNESNRSSAPEKKRFVALRTGIRMSYVEEGKGDPIILLHGYTDSSYSFSQIAPKLKAGRKLYALDLRGHGDSDRPRDGYRPSDMAADVIAFMDANMIRKASLIGHSMGSFVAIEIALAVPDRVENLVLIGTSTTGNNELIRNGKKAIDKLKDPIPVEFIEQFQLGTVYKRPSHDFFSAAVEESRKLPAYVWKQAVAGLIATDLSDRLEKVRVPVLLLWGEKENVFPRADQDRMLSGLPNAKLKAYPEVGHSPHWEAPDAVADDITAFLDSKD